MDPHKIVSREEWLVARKAHLANEKALTKARDELSRERRALPWVKIDKGYVFQGPNGKETLADLFDGRSQLIVYHFMLGPGSKHRCPGCSFLADHIDGSLVHLAHHDVTLLVVSRAPFAELAAFKKRMGWRFKWVSSFGSQFNYDYHVSFTNDQVSSGKVDYNYSMQDGNDELPGASVFYKDAIGDIFHTYSSYGRGGDLLIGAYNYLDLTPKGRNETGPNYALADWVRLHDSYGDGDSVDLSRSHHAAQASEACRGAVRDEP